MIKKIITIILVFFKQPQKLKKILKSLKVLFYEGVNGYKTKIKSMIRLSKNIKYETNNETKALEIFNYQQSELIENNIFINSLINKPIISIIMPTYNTPLIWLKKAIESVVKQIYLNWELCIIDDKSTDIDIIKYLESIQLNGDSRIKVVFKDKNTGISDTSNVGLNISTGDYIALLDHDDELTKDALFWVVKEINDYPDVDFIYSDECKIDDTPDKRMFHFFFKPDWSPELLFNSMYTGHLTVYKKKHNI